MCIAIHYFNYMNIFLAVLLFWGLWGFFFLPFRIVVKQIVGKEKYQEIVSKYKDMKRERIFGAIAVALGMLYLASFSITKVLDPNLPTVAGEKALYLFPIMMICGGYYCYSMGFVKAMAMVIKSTPSVAPKQS